MALHSFEDLAVPKQREWGDAARLKPEAPPETAPETRSFSFIDVLEKKTATESTLELSTNKEGEKQWLWNPEDLKMDELMIETFVQRIPLLREALEDFKDILKSAEASPKNRQSIQALLQGGRLKMIDTCIRRLEGLADFNLHSHPTPHRSVVVGKLDTYLEIQTQFDLLLELAEHTQVTLNAKNSKAQDEDIQEEADRYHLTAFDCIHDHLPKAFAVERKQDGSLTLLPTMEWKKLLRPGAEKQLIWALQHAFIPALESALEDFARTVSSLEPGTEGLQSRMGPRSYAAMKAAFEALEALKQKIQVFTQYITEDRNDTTALGEEFRTALQLRILTLELIEQGPKYVDFMILLYHRLRILDQQLDCHHPAAASMRQELLEGVENVLFYASKIQHVFTEAPEETPIQIPPYNVFTPWLSDTLCAQDLTKMPPMH